MTEHGSINTHQASRDIKPAGETEQAASDSTILSSTPRATTMCGDAELPIAGCARA